MAKRVIKGKGGYWQLIFVSLLLVHFLLLLNLKFTAWPEMQLWPYLMLKGWLPYRDIAIVHNPLLLVDLTIFNYIFGNGLIQLKIYTYITVLSIDVLLVWVTRNIWNRKIALYALLFFIPLQVYYEGNGLWFDLTMAFTAILTYFYTSKKSFFKAGIFWALTFFVKQTAVWFLVPIAFVILQDTPYKNLFKKAVRFILGVISIAIPILIIIWVVGIMPDFIFWAYKFGVGILPRAAGQVSFPDASHAIRALLPLSLLAFVAKDFSNNKGLNLLAWVIAGFMGTFPRWELFHFQPAIPFLAISGALAVSQIRKYNLVSRALFLLILLVNATLFGWFLFRDWGGGTRFYEQNIIEVSKYISRNTNVEDKIFVANTWDSIYPMSRTLPATKPWVPQLSWYLNIPGVEEGIVEDLAEIKPEIIVVSPYTQTGLSSYRPPLISDFIAGGYSASDYVGGHIIYKDKE